MKTLKYSATMCAAIALLIAGKSRAEDEKIALEKCPQPVQQALQKHAAGGTITKVEKGEENKATVYEAEIKTQDGKEIEVSVTPEGNLIATEYKIELKDCPAPVQKTISEKAANGKVKEIEKVVSAKNKVTYSAEIKPLKGDTMELEVSESGEVIKFEADKD